MSSWARVVGARRLAAHENASYLPGVSLPVSLTISSDLDAVLTTLVHSDAKPLIIPGVPVVGLAATCRDLAARLPALGLAHTPIVWTCKGFEEHTARLPHEIAVACGIADGLHLGTNARAALITRGLAEMSRFGVALGDLVLTATGELSRNRRVGLEIGAGRTLSDILASGITAEGMRCALAARARARKLNIELPITEAVCAVLFKGVAPKMAVSTLLAREARYESTAASPY